MGSCESGVAITDDQRYFVIEIGAGKVGVFVQKHENPLSARASLEPEHLSHLNGFWNDLWKTRFASAAIAVFGFASTQYWKFPPDRRFVYAAQSYSMQIYNSSHFGPFAPRVRKRTIARSMW